VELAVKERRVDVFVEHKAGEEFTCPEPSSSLRTKPGSVIGIAPSSTAP